MFTRIRKQDRERNRAFKQREKKKRETFFQNFLFPKISLFPQNQIRDKMHHGMLSSREKRREQNVNMRVPVAAALELRRAVVAKVVAHFYMYIFLYESVRVFVVMF